VFDKEIWMELRALHRQGWSISELARKFNLNRRTVARYVAADDAPSYGQRHCPAELSEAQLAYVKRRLAICSTLRATTLYREVTDDLGYGGSYVSFARRVRVLRPLEVKEPEVRFETAPGVQVQIDWTTLGHWALGTEMVELKALVAILGFSRMVAIAVATDQTRATTLSLIPRLLHELGGSPQEVLTDRDVAFVIGETAEHRPVFAPEWVDQTLALSTTPRACRPYRAKTKGKVERIIQEVKADFLPWLTGQGLPPRPSLSDYEERARTWAHDVVARRTHRTTGRIVGEAWDEERTHLEVIPARLTTLWSGRDIDPVNVIDIAAARDGGNTVEHRDLSAYARVAP
jgi:transposase